MRVRLIEYQESDSRGKPGYGTVTVEVVQDGEGEALALFAKAWPVRTQHDVDLLAERLREMLARCMA